MKDNNPQVVIGKRALLMVSSLVVLFLPFLSVEAQVVGLMCDYEENLIANGSFETPVLPANGFGWDVFPSEIDGLVWKVEWLEPVGAPAIPMLEIQNGYTARVGFQYAELDSNWTVAPGTPYNGEATPVAIQQTIATEVDETYFLSWSFSPIPHYDTLNVLEVLVNGLVVASNSANGFGLVDTAWMDDSITFVASSTNTVISFRDAGTVDSFGTLLDNICLNEVKGTSVDSSTSGAFTRSGGIIRPMAESTSADNFEEDKEEILPILIDEEPAPLVLGEQVSVVPVGAPNTGAGGSANNSALTLNNLLLTNRRQELI